MQLYKALFFIIASAQLTIPSQVLNNSPYTRYGLGEFIQPSTATFAGMSGTGVALSNVRHINFSNPATYSYLRKYNPIFDVSLMGKFSQLKSNTSTSNTTIGLRDFGLLLPVTKRGGIALALTPFSNTGYQINTYETLNEDSITYSYNGSGSINRLLIGGGYQVFNRGDSTTVSLGLNASFLFGTLQRDRDIIFENASYYNTKITNKTIVRGFTMDAGIHVAEKINKNWNVQFGATLNLGRKITAFQDFYAYNYVLDGFGVTEIEKDTTAYYEDNQGSIQLPAGITMGVALNYKKHWLFTAQYSLMNWHDYKETFNETEVVPDELVQSTRFSYGMEYVPTTVTENKNTSVFKLATYRMGLHYENTPYYLNNTHLKDYGISFGISLPLVSSGSTSTMNLGVELGKMGTTSNGLIEDNYLKFNVGFSLSPNARFDRWFKKRLYN